MERLEVKDRHNTFVHLAPLVGRLLTYGFIRKLIQTLGKTLCPWAQ